MKQKSLRQLARELGVSASYLSQVKNGKRPASKKVIAVLSNVKQKVEARQAQFVKQSVKQFRKFESEPPGTRTQNLVIKSHLLCQLS